MEFVNREEEAGWFEVSDEEGRVAALRTIATVVYGGRVYSLMGAIRLNDEGESEGGLVLVRQSSLMNSEGTRYEVVGDDSEIEHVMGQVMAALLMGAAPTEQMPEAAEQEPECGVAHGPREFCYCDDDAFLQ